MGVIYGELYQTSMYMTGSRIKMKLKNSHHAVLSLFTAEIGSDAHIPLCYNGLQYSGRWYVA